MYMGVIIMLGAIIGDMVGSIYEFNPFKSTDFPFLQEGCYCTDDSIMTVAVAQALMDSYKTSDEKIKDTLVRSMRYFGNLFPFSGYGGTFGAWLTFVNPEAYDSYGNGSAMRVSPAGWLFNDWEETLRVAKLTSEVTHNHSEGIKGAQAVAATIYMARKHMPKNEIKVYLEDQFGYDLSRTIDEIRPSYYFDVTCQGSVPESIICFLEGNSFEEVVRLAISLGGDADTQGAIAGSIAEAYYGIPDEIVAEAMNYIPEPIQAVIDRFYKFIKKIEANGYKGEFIEQRGDKRSRLLPRGITRVRHEVNHE